MTTISMVYSPPLPHTNEQQNILNFDIFVTFTTLCDYHPNNVTKEKFFCPMRERIVNGTTYFRLKGTDDSYLNAEGLAFITHLSTLLHVYMQGNCWSRHDHSCLSNDIQSSHKSCVLMIHSFITKINFSFVTEYSNFHFTCCTEIHTIHSFHYTFIHV